MTPEWSQIIQTLIAAALVPLALRALELYKWRRRVADLLEYNTQLAAAPAEARAELEKNPPPAPPDLGALKTILVLLFSGLALLAGARGPITAALLRRTPANDACPQTCPPGESCVGGVCGVVVLQPDARVGPQSAAVLLGSPLVDRYDPFSPPRNP
jgi:hypothetical protein